MAGKSLSSNTTFEEFFSSVSKYKIPGNRIRLLEWIKTIALLDPTIYPILAILAEYPITDITINATRDSKLNKKTLARYREDIAYRLFTEQDIVGHLMDIGLDYGWAGNAFVSPSASVIRTARCPKCGAKHNLSEFGNIKVDIDKTVPKGKRDELKKITFSGKCPDCKYTGELEVQEKPNPNVKMVKWSPMDIDIKYTDYDASYRYYYQPSKNLVGQFKQKDMHVLETADSALIYSLISGKTLEVKALYHFKNRGSSLLWPGWSLPPLLPVLTTVWYMNLLTRAQEAVAMDFLVPLRVIYYQNSDTDGKIKAASTRYKAMLSREIKAWRQDPNRVITLPFPVQQLELLYGGRNLLLSPELQFGQQRIAMGLGFPPSILTGDMTYSGGSITLRMLANKFATLTSGYRRYLNEFYKKYMFEDKYRASFELGMNKFQIADDVAKMQLLVNSQLLSNQSMYELLGVDSDKEMERKKVDAYENALLQMHSSKINAEAQKAMSIEEAMQQTIENPKQLEMILSNPTAQIWKFVTDFIQLDDTAKEKVSQQLQEEVPEVWQAMEEVMEANGLIPSSTPASGIPSNAQQVPVNGNTSQKAQTKTQNGASASPDKSETEAGRGKLFKEKQRATGE